VHVAVERDALAVSGWLAHAPIGVPAVEELHRPGRLRRAGVSWRDGRRVGHAFATAGVPVDTAMAVDVGSCRPSDYRQRLVEPASPEPVAGVKTAVRALARRLL